MPVSKISLELAKRLAKAAAEGRLSKKIPKKDVREITREMSRRPNSSGRPATGVDKQKVRTALTKREEAELKVENPVEKIKSRPSAKERRLGNIIAREEQRKSLAKPPAKKSTAQPKKEVFLTRGKTVASRSDVEEVTAKRLAREAAKKKQAEILKKLTPEQLRQVQARGLAKAADRRERSGQTKFGMDVKKPRELLDEKVIARAKELTAQEKNEIARKQAVEAGQRTEADRRVNEGLREITRLEKAKAIERAKTEMYFKYIKKPKGK